MASKTILVQFLVNYNSLSESFTLKQNSKFQQLNMIVSGLFDIQNSDKIVFYKINGEKIEDIKNDSFISSIFPEILNNDDIIELKIEVDSKSELEFIVIFNCQSQTIKLDSDKTLLVLLENIMSKFKELDFNQFFKLMHNKINLLEVFDVNKQLNEIIKELDVEKSNQCILIVELEKSVIYSSNVNIPQQSSRDSLTTSKMLGQSQKILRYVYLCGNNCKTEASNICAKCFIFLCDACKKREPHIMHLQDIIKLSKFNDLLKLFVEKCLKKIDENIVNDETFVFIQSFQTNIQNDIEQINKTFNFIKNLTEEIKEIQINYLISIQEKMNYNERFRDINKNLELVFNEFKDFNSESCEVELNMNFMKEMTEKVAKLIFDYKNLSNYFHIYRNANAAIEQTNKNIMQTLKEKCSINQSSFNIGTLSQKVSSNLADNVNPKKKNIIGQALLRLKDSSTIYYYKVKTNKVKSKTINDKANFRGYFQGEDEIELNLDNRLFIVTGKKYNVFFYYDYERNEIFKLNDLKFSHFFGNLIFCELNNCLYCIGGINSKKCEIYRNDELIKTNLSFSDKKVVQKTWEPLPDLNVSRHECSSIFHNNFLYVFFGYNNLTNFNNNTIERMNSHKNENWEILSYTNPSYLNVNLNSLSTIKYSDNEILILGGFDGKHYRDSVFLFNVKTSSFHQTQLKIPDLKKNTYYYFFKESSFVKIGEYENLIEGGLPNYCLFDSNNRVHLINTRKFQYQIITPQEK